MPVQLRTFLSCRLLGSTRTAWTISACERQKALRAASNSSWSVPALFACVLVSVVYRRWPIVLWSAFNGGFRYSRMFSFTLFRTCNWALKTNRRAQWRHTTTTIKTLSKSVLCRPSRSLTRSQREHVNDTGRWGCPQFRRRSFVPCLCCRHWPGWQVRQNILSEYR